MAHLFSWLACLFILMPSTVCASVLVDLQSSEGKLSARLTISGDTLITDNQGQVKLTGTDRLLCVLTVRAPEQMTVSLPSFNGPSFGDFTLLDQGETKTRRTDYGLDHERRWFIEPYNPGPYQLPELLISGQQGDLATQLILARPTLTAIAIEGDNLSDILPPQAPAISWPWIISWAAAALLILALLGWLMIRLKNKGPRVLPPRERALAEMTGLAELPPAEQIERLAFILRCYLASRFELRCLEQTYDEYAPSISSCAEIPEESRNIFLTILQRCDLLKFSKIDPEPGEPEQLIEQIKAGLEACPLAKPDDKTCGRW